MLLMCNFVTVFRDVNFILETPSTDILFIIVILGPCRIVDILLAIAGPASIPIIVTTTCYKHIIFTRYIFLFNPFYPLCVSVATRKRKSNTVKGANTSAIQPQARNLFNPRDQISCLVPAKFIKILGELHSAFQNDLKCTHFYQADGNCRGKPPRNQCRNQSGKKLCRKDASDCRR